MKISGIIWLEQIVEKIEHKHRVRQDEVREILKSSSHFRFVEKGHRRGENVYSALGQTSAGRYLIVFFVRKKTQQALIVSKEQGQVLDLAFHLSLPAFTLGMRRQAEGGR